MAIGDAYASVNDYRSRLQRSDNGADTQIRRDLLAVSRYIDRVTGYIKTGFNADASDVTRVVKVPSANRGERYLFIPPLSAAPTSVTVDTDRDGDFSDETALTLTQYTGDILYHPENYEDGPEPRPITSLELTSWGDRSFTVWPANALVQIVGKWGWPAVPEPVRSATIELTGILRLESPRATETVSEVDFTTRTSQDANRILQGLTQTYRTAGHFL